MSNLLGKLKRAVHKIKFILNFSINRCWKLASIIGRSSSSSRRGLSFDYERSGLRAFVEDSGSEEGPGSSSRELRRTTSYPSEGDGDGNGDDDIDERADAFIANFYKQLQFERQISLQIRYSTPNN